MKVFLFQKVEVVNSCILVKYKALLDEIKLLNTRNEGIIELRPSKKCLEVPAKIVSSRITYITEVYKIFWLAGLID